MRQLEYPGTYDTTHNELLGFLIGSCSIVREGQVAGSQRLSHWNQRD